MQTPVRYYITRDEDRPVVRSIPVSMRPEQRKVEDQNLVETEQTTAPPAPEKAAGRARVASIMRNAVRRPTQMKQ
jgi:hypothetical protein